MPEKDLASRQRTEANKCVSNPTFTQAMPIPDKVLGDTVLTDDNIKVILMGHGMYPAVGNPQFWQKQILTEFNGLLQKQDTHTRSEVARMLKVNLYTVNGISFLDSEFLVRLIKELKGK